MSDLIAATASPSGSPPAVGVASPTPEAEPEPRKLDSLEAIVAEILELTGMDSLGDVPSTKHAWLLDPVSMKRVHVEVGQPMPIDTKTQVFAIFHELDEARVYTMNAGVPIECYRFNAAGISASVFSSMEQFVDALADEYKTLLGDDDDLEDDDAPTS